MPTTLPSSSFEKEHRLAFEPSSSMIVAVFSGSVGGSWIFAGTLGDDVWTHFQFEMVVGPWWKDVRDVVPFVTITGFDQTNADEDDEQGWTISNLKWDTVGGSEGSHLKEKRIRLTFSGTVKGENSPITRFAYYVTAKGKALGEGGINSP